MTVKTYKNQHGEIINIPEEFSLKIKEISNGGFQVNLSDIEGRSVNNQGTDLDKMIERAVIDLGKINQIELLIEDITETNARTLWGKLLGKKTETYHLILVQKNNSKNKFIIVIGVHEAQAIAMALERLTPTRPLINDLFKNAAVQFGYILDYILIDKIDNGIIYSTMFYSSDSKTVELDAAPADAIAQALRHNSKIMITKNVSQSLRME